MLQVENWLNPLRTKQRWAVLCMLILCACEGRLGIEGDIATEQLITMVNRAEKVFFERHGRYADFGALGPQGEALVPKDLNIGAPSGYEFKIVIVDAGYRLNAWPTRQGTNGFASFYSDETGVIRRSWGPELATVTSPPITENANR